MLGVLLDILFEEMDEDNELIAVRAIRSEDHKVVSSQYVNNVDDAYEFARKNRDTSNVYFGTCTRSEPKPEISFVAKAHCVWADLDIGEGSDFEKHQAVNDLNFIFPPSIIVDSGGGLHLYWLLNEATSGLEKVTEVVSAIATLVGGDNVADVARLFRVDNTFNYKYKTPKPVRVLSDTVNRYSLDDLMAATTVQEKSASKIKSGSSAGYKSRSERDWAVIRDLVMAGISDAGIHSIFALTKIGDLSRKGVNADKYLQLTIDRVREKTGILENTLQEAKTSFGGIFEKDDGYWRLGKDGADQLSTFVIDPQTLLRGSKDEMSITSTPDVILGEIRAMGKSWQNIAITKTAFTRVETLLKELPVIEWQWLAKDIDVRILLPYLVQKIERTGAPTKKAATQLGEFEGRWLGTSQTIDADRGILSVRDSPVVLLPTKQERPTISFANGATSLHIHDFFESAVQLNRPQVIWPILGWWAACALKVKLANRGYRFPSLNLYGTRGSGKTSIVTRVLQGLSGYNEPRTYDCNTTQFVMLSLLGSSVSVPIAFSEYRRSSLKAPDRILRYLLLLYDTGHDPRGRADQTVVDYILSAPISVDGEDAITDPAALERIIQINMHPEDVMEGSEAFNSFEVLTSKYNLRAIGTEYVMFALAHDLMLERASQLTREAFQATMPDRVRRNITVIMSGLLCFEAWAIKHSAPFPEVSKVFVQDVFTETLEALINVASGRTQILADELIEDLINEASRSAGVDPPFVYKYVDSDNILWFHLSTALSWWYKHRRSQNRPVLDSAAIKSQLKERMVSETGLTGQYIADRKPVSIDGSTRHCYGIDVTAAIDAGLDIPGTLATSFFYTVPNTSSKKEVNK